MNEKNNILIRKFKPSDINGIINLLNIVFDNNFTREWWKWKYELNPNGFFGEDGDIWVAEANNQIVGHYAIIPEAIKFYSKVITVAQSVDTAVHPDYRRRGIFTNLANKVYADAKNRYEFIYGFPSEMAYKGFIKLGWKDFKIESFNKVLNYDNVLSMKFGNKIIKWIFGLGIKMLIKINQTYKSLYKKGKKGHISEIKEIDNFPIEINSFYNEISKDYDFILERTYKYLNWRFSNKFGNYQIFIAHSIKDKEIMGYIVLHKIKHVLNIVDLVTLQGENNTMINLINRAIKIGNDENVDLIRCIYPRENKQSGLLIKLGFFSPDKILRFLKRYSVRYILYNLTDKEFISDMKNWYYTLADTDAA